MSDISALRNINTYTFRNDSVFTIRDNNGTKHIMSINEHLTNNYVTYENGSIEYNKSYIKIEGRDDSDAFQCYQYILLPPKFPGKIKIEDDVEFDCPRVFSSITHGLVEIRFDMGKDKVKLNPLHEMMYHDILSIIRKYVDEESSLELYEEELSEENFNKSSENQEKDLNEKYLKELFEDGYDMIYNEKVYFEDMHEEISEYNEKIMTEAINSLLKYECDYEFKYHIHNYGEYIEVECV